MPARSVYCTRAKSPAMMSPPLPPMILSPSKPPKITSGNVESWALTVSRSETPPAVCAIGSPVAERVNGSPVVEPPEVLRTKNPS